MSVLRLASSILALLLLASLSALPSPGDNVLDGADSQQLLIVLAPDAVPPRALADLGPQGVHAPGPQSLGQDPGAITIPYMGENIPETGQ